MREISENEIDQVKGGIWSWFAGYAAGKAIDWYFTGYADWVSNGAGGWKETYNGRGYSDPLL
ncbi:hypothetical protein [Microbulbifer sp. M83]|uniref:hypothetical protein n=1 Tax=unclassified Microbulbifer TaxID=2619833 RepID=UPI002FE316AA